MFESLTRSSAWRPKRAALSAFLDSIIENMPAMVFVKDAKDLRFERFNRAGEELLGLSRDAMLGKTDYDFFPKDQADFFVQKDREVLERGTLDDIPEEPIQTPRGTRWLHTRKIPIADADGRAAHLLGISIDITERARSRAHRAEPARAPGRAHSAELKPQIDERVRAESALARTEEQLRQAQKMEAIGRLAGGVAHDFNNLLTVILSYSQLALQSSRARRRRAARRARADPARRRARRPSSRASCSRSAASRCSQPRTLDLDEVVRGMERMLRRLIGEDVELAIGTAPQLGSVRADRSQIEQVVMNLVVNARDAMPTGGKLTIETANVTSTSSTPRRTWARRVGPHVMLAVTDTGVGMDRQTRRAHLRAVLHHQGAGQGHRPRPLDRVRHRAAERRHDLGLQRARPGHGVQGLPAVVDAVADAQRGPLPQPAARSCAAPRRSCWSRTKSGARARRRRAAAQRLPRARSQHAVAKRSRSRARHAGTIDLLLTDVVMPEMSGRELAEMLVRAPAGIARAVHVGLHRRRDRAPRRARIGGRVLAKATDAGCARATRTPSARPQAEQQSLPGVGR